MTLSKHLSWTVLVLLCTMGSLWSQGATDGEFRVEMEDGRTAIQGAPLNFTISRFDKNGDFDAQFDWFGARLRLSGLSDCAGDHAAIEEILERPADLEGRQTTTMERLEDGRLRIGAGIIGGPLAVHRGKSKITALDAPISGFWSIIPAICAILLAILFRQVYVALFAGIWVGAWCIAGGPWDGFVVAATEIIPSAVAQTDKVSIIIFSTMLGGVVALVARMGGTKALVEAIARRGESRRGAQFTTWISGILIFFDDYANALLVGNTMRPVTDRFRVSREKLAFLVDSTSAPVACVFIISTWIATEIDYIQGRLASETVRNATGFAADAGYDVFLKTIPYNFYPLYCLVFGLTICLSGRDFGPMLKAEKRAINEGKVFGDDAHPLSSPEMDDLEPVDPNRAHWWNAIVPIGTVVLSVLGFLYLTGASSFDAKADALRADIVGWESQRDSATILTEKAKLATQIAVGKSELPHLESPGLRSIFGASDSYFALLMAAFLGVLVAVSLAVTQKLLRIGEAIETVVAGIKAMIPAVLVLCLAWGLQAVCERLATSQWLIEHVNFTATLLPFVIFLLAAFVGFATGTSWGTMGILVPLTIDYAVGISAENSMAVAETQTLLVAAVGGVLAGAVFGDHCSPISDTTIMSSMASGSDHVDHVKTQLPYAMTVAAIAILVGYLPAGFGISPVILLPLGAVTVVGAVFVLGRKA